MKKNTFIVEINNKESQSWQGSIEWVQSQKKQSFRSVLEMLRLMESALDDEKEVKWEQNE